MVDIKAALTPGQFLICCNDYHGELVVGNVNKESLLDMWNSYKPLRKDIRNGIYEMPLCKKCNS